MTIIIRRPRTVQPRSHQQTGGSLSKGLTSSFDGRLVYDNGFPYLGTVYPIYDAYVDSRVYRDTVGYAFTGTQASLVITNSQPLAAASPWAFSFTHAPTANVSLSHAFGFGLAVTASVRSIKSDASVDGTYRACLNFNSNYYFWGSGADWDTGIPWDTDGGLHTALFSHDGTNIYFWRDGVLRATSARPGAIVATPAGRLVIMGGYHASGTQAPSSTIIVGRTWNRHIVPPEAALYTRNPWCLYQDSFVLPTPTVAAPTAPTLSSLSAINVTATSAQPRMTYTF